MLFFTTRSSELQNRKKRQVRTKSKNRIERLKLAVLNTKPGVCSERAVIWTAYHKDKANQTKSSHVKIAEALRDVLTQKSIQIYPDELIVGNYTSKRVGGSIFPELHGIPVLLDLFKFGSRKTNPLDISLLDMWRLLKVVPFWMFDFMALKAYPSLIKTALLVIHQLKGHYYIINESGGISHFAPDYAKLVSMGTDGIIEEALSFQKKVDPASEAWQFYEGVKIVNQALADFGKRYADLARQMADCEIVKKRKAELNKIAKVCQNVPRKGAKSLHEAIQSIFFAQIAINLESLDNSVCPGRLDQILYPYFQQDLARKKISRNTAKELLSAFSIKMSEIIPVFSELLTRIHGGMFNGQVVTVGGVDAKGKDATNELTYIFLEIMDELRMRQPNYHARMHQDSPAPYIDKICTMLSKGSNSPALYNDDVIVATMIQNRYTIEDARNYTGIGCVEPACQGKSFSSTDAALVNVPILLELALNSGKRFGARIRSGARTMPVDRMTSMADVTDAFEAQLEYTIDKLIKDLHAIEMANRHFHPTPLSSSLIQGCLSSGKCSTAGGALYNFSGIQCVAPADVGDALYAIEKAVFIDHKVTLPELVSHLFQNLSDAGFYQYLKHLDKFGNDNPDVDHWVVYVIDRFVEMLRPYRNTRGGNYVAGLYSVTTHQFYGSITGALPNGRRQGESFSSGISPENGMDRLGPTAMLNSVNRIDFSTTGNGINLNLKFDRQTLNNQAGVAALASLLKTYFRRGGMQAQINVIDPSMLKAARDNPELFPNLLVRVSGYSAYFNDLTPEMKDDIIKRSNLCL